MLPNESMSVSRCGHGHFGSDPPHTVVWVRGEHDIATRVNLSATIAQAALVDDADIVVDLSGVTFMDASTIGALVDARNRLRACSRSLSVRAPSPRARRLLDLCGLALLIDEHPAPAQPPMATALRSWVVVPAWDRGPDFAPLPDPAEAFSPNSASPPVVEEARSWEPARATARRRIEPAAPVQPPRAVS